MTDLPDSRQLIEIEETKFRAAVAESTQQKIGGAINFILNRILETKRAIGDGPYNAVTPPFLGVDGFMNFRNASTAIDAWFCVEDQTGLTSGFTEWDVEMQTVSGGAWTTILSTRPQIQWNAPSNTRIHVGSAIALTQAPVFSVTSIPAGAALRANLTAVPAGTLNPDTAGFTVEINTRPA